MKFGVKHSLYITASSVLTIRKISKRSLGFEEPFYTRKIKKPATGAASF